MDDIAARGPLRFFLDMPDPRAKNVRHRLIDLLVLALCAVICGADDWKDVAHFTRCKAEFFTALLNLKHGLPSADTFRRTFARLCPEAMERCFVAWMKSLVDLRGTLVNIDGKSLRQSFDHGWDKSGMAHMVSLFVSHNAQVFSQIKCDGKGQEIQTILNILELIDVRGALVTIDAMGCQREIAEKIALAGGDYLLDFGELSRAAVKENQPTLREQIERTFKEAELEKFAGWEHSAARSEEVGHGREEERRVCVIGSIEHLRTGERWAGLSAIVKVESKRQVIGTAEPSVESRYYITNRKGLSAEQASGAVRGHWAVENKLHWQLDVSFGEDKSRLRKHHGAENFSRLRRIALNLLKANQEKHSIKTKRKACGWDHDYLIAVLTG